MVKNKHIEASYQQLIEAIKEELANGCKFETKVEYNDTRIVLNENPDVSILISNIDQQSYVSTFQINADIFDSVSDVLRTAKEDAKKIEIKNLENRLRELKGLNA